MGNLFGKSQVNPPVQDVGKVPPAVLIRWLRQGIELGICPLCRVSHKADREYIRQFSDEGCGDAEAMAGLAAAHGFCAEHAAMLQRIDLGLKSMLGVATIYVELFADIAAELQRIDPAAPVTDGRCPACVSRDRSVAQNAHYLVACLAARAGTIAEGFPGSPGLCFPHFELVWSVDGPARVRRLLLDVQRRAVREIQADLGEFIRKEGAEAKHEPKAAEQDAWWRAIRLTVGWPAPRESAALPEPSDAVASACPEV